MNLCTRPSALLCFPGPQRLPPPGQGQGPALSGPGFSPATALFISDLTLRFLQPLCSPASFPLQPCCCFIMEKEHKASSAETLLQTTILYFLSMPPIFKQFFLFFPALPCPPALPTHYILCPIKQCLSAGLIFFDLAHQLARLTAPFSVFTSLGFASFSDTLDVPVCSC